MPRLIAKLSRCASFMGERLANMLAWRRAQWRAVAGKCRTESDLLAFGLASVRM